MKLCETFKLFVLSFFVIINSNSLLASDYPTKPINVMVGYSAGSAVAGINQLKDNLSKDDIVVVIFHDHGTRYVGKLFNDDWMKKQGFMK